jgi:hypothetical protein
MKEKARSFVKGLEKRLSSRRQEYVEKTKMPRGSGKNI